MSALRAVSAERAAQDAKWGEQNHPNGTGDRRSRALCNLMRRKCQDAFRDGVGTWRHVLLEEVYEAMAERDPHLLRAELIQTAAVCVAWAEAIDRAESELAATA